LVQEHPKVYRGDIRKHWICAENKWLAARYGLQAVYIRSYRGKRRSLAHDLTELIEHLLPLARESGDARFMAPLRLVERIETGSERQRRLYRESGSWKKLIEDMTRRFYEELEAPLSQANPDVANQASLPG
jgi:carboxylate-amine ligase